MGPISVHFSPFQGSLTHTGASGELQSHILALFWNFESFSSFFCEWIILLNILDSIVWIFFEWIFRILFWIEFWIESFLGPIQWKNEFSKRIKQGYRGVLVLTWGPRNPHKVWQGPCYNLFTLWSLLIWLYGWTSYHLIFSCAKNDVKPSFLVSITSQ